MMKRSASILALFALFIACQAAARPIVASLPAAAPQEITGHLVMQSQSGDWIGQGQNYEYSSLTGSFTDLTAASDGQVDYVRIIYDDSDHWWYLEFSTRQLGVPLAPGTYRNADYYPGEDAGRPGMAIAGDNRGCTASGEFTVMEAVYDYSVDPPRVVSFAASFVQHCDQQTAALTGTITFSGDPLPPVRPAVFLPLLAHDYELPLVAINPEPIAVRPVTSVGETYYTTTFTLAGQLPAAGHFYLSAAPDSLTPAKVDDQLAVVVNGEEVYTVFLSDPQVIRLPRDLVASWAGRPVTVIFRDVYGDALGSLPVWLVWAP